MDEKESTGADTPTIVIDGLEPDTEYVAVFNGLNIYQAGRAFALFRTKPESISTFRIIAFSCDRPDRMFLGRGSV